MPELDSIHPSRSLRAGDLNGRRTRATIAAVTVESVGQGRNAERKAVVTFEETTLKPLILNKTNSYRIGELTGCTNTDDWPGAAVMLVPSTTEFQGKVVPCVRIDAVPVTRMKPTARVPDQIDEALPTAAEPEF